MLSLNPASVHSRRYSCFLMHMMVDLKASGTAGYSKLLEDWELPIAAHRTVERRTGFTRSAG